MKRLGLKEKDTEDRAHWRGLVRDRHGLTHASVDC
jgi:hypothetical protein